MILQILSTCYLEFDANSTKQGTHPGLKRKYILKETRDFFSFMTHSFAIYTTHGKLQFNSSKNKIRCIKLIFFGGFNF